MIGIRTVTEDGEVLDSFEPPKHKLLFVLFGLLLYLSLVLLITLAYITVNKTEKEQQEAKALQERTIVLQQRIDNLDILLETLETKK